MAKYVISSITVFDCRAPMGTITEHEGQTSSAPHITAIVASSKGFACSAGHGIVVVYEKTEDKDSYKKSREIRVSFPSCQ